MSSRSAPPPTHQEVQRKLSVHSAVRPPPKKPTISTLPVSGTESDSDSALSPDTASPPAIMPAASIASAMVANSSQLQAIAERDAGSGEESEEEDDDEEGGWRVETATGAAQRGTHDETVIKTGYLWKKGERRKTWKKRWFVLRPAHLAFYKTNAEYKLLRLLDLNDVHSCTQVALKKHANTFGLVSPVRTFYLQAESVHDVQSWVSAINEARNTLLSTSTTNSNTQPIPIPTTPITSNPRTPRASSSPSHSPYGHQVTSSESDDASPNSQAFVGNSIASPGAPSGAGDATSPSKTVHSGYLMKCGSRRHNWHKRWFVLSGEKLIYSRSHMDTKPHRQIPLSMILDALEYELPVHRQAPNVSSPPLMAPPPVSAAAPDGHHEGEGAGKAANTFKIVTTKRTLLLCAPSEDEEIKWLSVVRALIARRSGQGVVPGEAAAPSPPSSKIGGAGATATTAATTEGGATPAGGGSGMSTTGHKRRDSFARRLSLSSGGGGGAPGAGAGTAPQEGASERQS